MKKILCKIGIHKYEFNDAVLVTSDKVCCGKKTAGTVLKCKMCGHECFEFSNGIRVKLNNFSLSLIDGEKVLHIY